jgi:S1-C subfamily serine protease
LRWLQRLWNLFEDACVRHPCIPVALVTSSVLLLAVIACSYGYYVARTGIAYNAAGEASGSEFRFEDGADMTSQRASVIRMYSTGAGGLSYGSGVIVDYKGDTYVLTCAHMVSDSESGTMKSAYAVAGREGVNMVEAEGTSAELIPVAIDSTHDMAVLRIPDSTAMEESGASAESVATAKEISALPKSAMSYTPAQVRDSLYVVGNPSNVGERVLDASVVLVDVSTSGEGYEHMDAMDKFPIGGFSGGGVFDAVTGDLVGIVSLGMKARNYTMSGDEIGGYFIPIGLYAELLSYTERMQCTGTDRLLVIGDIADSGIGA